MSEMEAFVSGTGLCTDGGVHASNGCIVFIQQNPQLRLHMTEAKEVLFLGWSYSELK